MNAAGLWTVIALAAVGTYALRASFLAVADRAAEVPAGVARLLRMIPPAALAAIVALAVVEPSPDASTAGKVVAVAAAAGATWWRRNLVLAIVVGMGVLLAFDAVV